MEYRRYSSTPWIYAPNTATVPLLSLAYSYEWWSVAGLELAWRDAVVGYPSASIRAIVINFADLMLTVRIKGDPRSPLSLDATPTVEVAASGLTDFKFA